ncbi:aluminum-activated malate transporter 12-like [Primulina eburnea]|uniref:aluminum-activated malate transporter 12-like n=1 Tax=Primulina eburnea TaxID=1245227 RepID=UPI003C6C04E3
MKGIVKGENKNVFRSFVSSFLEEMKTKRVIHSIKVALALVLVSLLYLLNPLFKQVGENAMWAIMTVVVVFEFYTGATLGKGINRGIGTVLGGGLGCLAAILADEIGGIGNHVTVGLSIFIFGAGATYCRTIPRIKRRYDYGAMIFILTFNLVVVSGIRAEKVVELARDRLATIGMGFAICMFISLFIFPIWASDELHYSMASRFSKLSTSIQGCLDEYFTITSEKENKQEIGGAYIQACKAVLNSKSNDEALANFAKWEPWHGKFGLNYPWTKYLEIGEYLRDLGVLVLSLQQCIQSPKQPTSMQRQKMKEPCEILMISIVFILKELGESTKKMDRCQAKNLLSPNLQSLKLQFTPQYPSSKIDGTLTSDENLAIASFNFLLMQIVERVEILAKKVEELGELADFSSTKFECKCIEKFIPRDGNTRQPPVAAVLATKRSRSCVRP